MSAPPVPPRPAASPATAAAGGGGADRRHDPSVRGALIGALAPAGAAAVMPTVEEWTRRAAALTAFVHREVPRTLPPVTVFVTPVERQAGR